jgi:hypothetical protein
MLAKQVWRLIAEPNSLCARVLKAKYFPDGNILKAGAKPGASFTWQSIVVGIQSFKGGIFGVLGMASPSTSGGTRGYQAAPTERS